jgi:hypothetical protein
MTGEQVELNSMVGQVGCRSSRHPTHFDPSSLEANGTPRRDEHYPLGPPLLSQVAPYDMASKVARLSSLESIGIL